MRIYRTGVKIVGGTNKKEKAINPMDVSWSEFLIVKKAVNGESIPLFSCTIHVYPNILGI